jgi:hypothetical protein
MEWELSPELPRFCAIEQRRRDFDMHKALFTTLVAALMAPTYAPAIAGDRHSDCFSGRYPEPLCKARVWHRGKTVVVEEREPDVFILGYPPYVVVNTRHE